MPANSQLRQTVIVAARPLQLALEAAACHCWQIGPDEAAFASVKAAMDRCLTELRATGLWGAANRLLSSELWKIAGPLLEHGWLLNRARTKPRGYAGDYELLARMYASAQCDDPLVQILDRYFQEDAAPIAVRNRMRMISELIAQEVRMRRASGGDRIIKIAI